MLDPSGRKGKARAAARLARVGIDPAGLEHREPGAALLRDGRLEWLTSAGTWPGILAHAASAGPDGAIAINAPPTRPPGHCSPGDASPCRTDRGTRSRQPEREPGGMRVPTLATAFMEVLARQGERIAAAVRALATSRWRSIRSRPSSRSACRQPARGAAGRRRIRRAINPRVPGPDRPHANGHRPDAIGWAPMASFWLQGRPRSVDRPEEGVMIVPDVEDASPGRR